MKQKRLKKKTCSLLLAAAMILTSFPMSGKEARAAGTSDHSLSVTAFATKEQLMDETFAPDGDGNSFTIGKLAFGKNQAPNLEGTVVEWYILGKDDGVLGEDGETTENTVLFATVRIGKRSPQFNGNTSSKSYDTGWGCVYKDNASGPEEVNANHYGGSNLRKELNAIAEDTECFTTAEQALMNETTVTTYDTKAGANYTTTDKLYALNSEINGFCKTITAGTNDQIALAKDTYWSDNNDVDFWLRAPDQTYSGRARQADTGVWVISKNVDGFYALVPAFNLNLSSVIFASAAKAASSGNTEAGTIEDGTAMTLRLNGSDEKIGTVVYDEATGNIMAQKDTDATETVSLVVQGNDGTKDWYYSVPAGGETVVTKEQIQTACGISGDISLADCKIWLETTIDNVAYARMAKAATPVTITGSDQTLTYDVSAIDVSKYFSIDTNDVTPTYSLVTESGVTTGTGNLSGKELTVTKIGVFKVKLTTAAQGNYAAGEKTITLTITSKSLTDDMVTIASGPHYYTGSAATPAVTVKDGSKTLVSGTDYTVSYKNNTNVGTATVTVAGKGNYTGTIEKTFDIILTDADKVAAAKRVVEETLAGITATNSTTKQEIQEKIDTALTNAGISDVTVTVGDIAKTEATTSVAGSVSGSISITKGSASDSVAISKTIEKLPKTEEEKVADAKKVVEETLAGMTATNSTTKQEIQNKIDEALTQAGMTEVIVTVGELAKTEATTEAAGSIGGTISIVSKKDPGETDSVPIIKTIEKLPKTEAEKVADAKKVVEETLEGITASNSTTKQEIQDKIDTALTQAGMTDVTVTVGELAKTEATTEEAGSIGGTISIVSKNDPGETDSVPIIKTIEKLPKTETEKVADAKKVVEETLAGITATNSTTKREIQEKIDTALTQAGITEVTVTVGELEKTEATTEAAGSIGGTISIVSKNDSDVTDSVPIIKTIEKLPKTEAEKVADAKKVVEDVLEDVLAGITTASEVTSEDIQREIDEALTNAGITDVTVTVGELEKTEATTEEEGSISGSVTLVSENDSDVTDSVPIIKTIAQLPTHTHTWTWIITKEATADEEGEMTGTCICGEVTTETIPKTGESGSGTVIVKEDAENECNGSLEDKEDVKGKVSLTDTEKEQLNTGEDLVIILRLKDVSVAADTQEKTEIQNKLETNTLGTFLDIELLKQIGGTETKITETTDEIEITFEIPEHLRNSDDTMTRTYQIMRNHDGVVDILDVENYDESAHLLTFKTDRFSTYALVYRDAAKNPTDTPGPTETPGTPTATPVTTDTPDTSTPTPVPTNTPGIPTATPVTTETPGIPTATPVTTETPDIPTATPVTTDTPGTPAPTPGTTDTPTPTPGTTDTPVTPTATPGATDIPGTPAPTPGTTDLAVVPTATPGTTAMPDQPKPSTTPGTVSEEQTVSKEIVEKNELSLNARLKVSQTGKKINIKWGKVAGADGYDVYVQYCGKKFTKKSITAIKSGMITKVTVKKVNGKPLKLKKNYKIYILAYKLVDGKKVTLGRTIIAHIVGRKNTKYTNVKAVKVKKRYYSLKRGRTATIKASTVLVSKGKKQLTDAHAKEFRYATDKKEVATVSKKGKIKAVGKGSCTIYVYARNGYAKKIKIKVKK